VPLTRATWLMRTAILVTSLLWLLAPMPPVAQEAPQGQLGPAPRLPPEALKEPETARAPLGVESLSLVDPGDRHSVVNLYQNVYVPAHATPNDWNGSVAGCNAGTTGVAYENATLDMVNFFRAMVELPPVVFEVVKNNKSQQAALMMTANNSLSHFPPASWTCYTADGAEAAGKSNLALGVAGAPAVALYIHDPGAGNTAVGHRRWILFPRQVQMATGSTSNANALWVIDAFGTRPTTPEIVAWPPVGFVPYQIVYPRWSFSVNTGSAVSFTGASVSVMRGSDPVALNLLTNATGFGDNTLVWEPSGLSFGAGMSDQFFTVHVNNVTVGGVPRNFTYPVTVIDPAAVPPPTFTDHPLLPGVTAVKGVHITELRSAIGVLRTRYGLPAFPWTDATLTQGVTVVKAVHLAELRTALAQAYTTAGLAPPVYSTVTIAPGVTIAAGHITELRAAVLALW